MVVFSPDAALYPSVVFVGRNPAQVPAARNFELTQIRKLSVIPAQSVWSVFNG